MDFSRPVVVQRLGGALVAAVDAAVAEAAQLVKTKMCIQWSKGRCTASDCRFAHVLDELRAPPDLRTGSEGKMRRMESI
eukprot:Skav201714  [mRNA]  locus=scaffold311:169038:169359:+ [translate_table: standard]